jgi:hypothetical protein
MHDGLLVQVPAPSVQLWAISLKGLMEEALAAVCPGAVPLTKVELLGDRWGEPVSTLG